MVFTFDFHQALNPMAFDIFEQIFWIYIYINVFIYAYVYAISNNQCTLAKVPKHRHRLAHLNDLIEK